MFYSNEDLSLGQSFEGRTFRKQVLVAVDFGLARAVGIMYTSGLAEKYHMRACVRLFFSFFFSISSAESSKMPYATLVGW